jgi:hypothetical protein
MVSTHAGHPRSRLNGQEAAMITRHLGGRLAGEPQRGRPAQADQQHPARQLRNLAGASRRVARPRRLVAPSLNRGRPAALGA